MFEAGIQVILAAQHDNMREVRIVNMCVDSEKTFEYNLNNLHEVSREGDANHRGENCLII